MRTSHLRPISRISMGFTLIELMIAVAIMAIIAAVAFPSYQASIRKGKRSDAMAAVSAIQQAQERWRSNHTTYSTDLSSSALNVSEPSLYALTVSAPPSPATLSNGYVVVAEGRGAQADDTDCKLMSLKLVDGNITYASCSSSGCSFTYAASNKCWNR